MIHSKRICFHMIPLLSVYLFVGYREKKSQRCYGIMGLWDYNMPCKSSHIECTMYYMHTNYVAAEVFLFTRSYH